MLGNRESERLKVTALNLFHPAASPLFQKVSFFILRHNLLMGEGEPACRQAGVGVKIPQRKEKGYES
jgi:hypothetical protein